MKKSDNLRKLRDFVSDSLAILDSMEMNERCLISDSVLAKKTLFERDVELNEYEIRRRIKENSIRKKRVTELNDKVELKEKENELFYENVKKKFQSNDLTFELANKRKQCAISEAKKHKAQLNDIISSVANLTKIYENERSDIILSQEIINDVKIMVEKYNNHLDEIDQEIEQQIANINFRPKNEGKVEDNENIINQPEVEFPTDTVEEKISDENKVTKSGIEESINEITAPPNTEETPITDIGEENVIPKGIIKKNNFKGKTTNKTKNSTKGRRINKRGVKYAKSKKRKKSQLKRRTKKSKRSMSELSKSEDQSSVVPSEILEEVKPVEANQGVDEGNKEKDNVKSGSCCGGSKTVKTEPQKVEEVVVPEEVPAESEVVSEKIKKKHKKSRPKRPKSQSQNRSKRKGNSKLRSKSAPLKSRKNIGKRKPNKGNKKPRPKKQEIQKKTKPVENDIKPSEEEIKPKTTTLGNVIIEEPIKESNLRSDEGNKENITVNETPTTISEPKQNELKNQLAEPNDGEAEEKLEDKAESIKEPMVALDGDQFQEKSEICDTITLEVQNKRSKQRKLLSLNELLDKMKKSEMRYEDMLEKLQKQKAPSKSFDAGGSMENEAVKTENSQDVKNSKEMSINQISQRNDGKKSENTMLSHPVNINKSEDGRKSKETYPHSDISKNTKEKSRTKPVIGFENELEKNNKYFECINKQKKEFLPLLYTNDQLLKKGNYDSKPIVRGTKVIYNYKFLVSQSRKEKDELKEINRKLIVSKISKRSQDSSTTVSRSGDSCIVMELTPSTEVPEEDEEDSKKSEDDEPMLSIDLSKGSDVAEKKGLSPVTQVTSQEIIVVSERKSIEKASKDSKVEDNKEDTKENNKEDTKDDKKQADREQVDEKRGDKKPDDQKQDDKKQDDTKPSEKNEDTEENIVEKSKTDSNEEAEEEPKEDANAVEEKKASINKSREESLKNVKNPEVVKSNKCGCFQICSSQKVNKASVVIEPEEQVETLSVEEEEVVQIKKEESDTSNSLSVGDDNNIETIDEDIIPFVRVQSDDEDNIDLPEEDIGNVRLWKKFKYFEQSEDTRDKKLVCIIRAKPECLLKRKGIQCDVIKPKDELPKIETKENYASKIFQLSPRGENSPKLDCDMPYLIAIPYAKFNEDSKKPNIVQFNQEQNKWIELLTQTIQFEDVKEAERFVECRLSNPFGIFGVITFAKKDLFTFNKEGISLPFSAEPNIVFSVPEDAVRITIKAVAKATKMRPSFWKEIKNKHEHSDLEFLTSSSSIVEIESKRKKLKTPAVISFFCPEDLLPKPKENVVEKPVIPIESDSFDKSEGASTETEKKLLTPFQRSLIIPTLSSSTIVQNTRFLTYTPEEEKWNLVDNAKIKFDKNQDQLAAELPIIQSTKCILVRTKRNTSDEAAVRASKIISNEFSVRNCIIALFQLSKEPKEFVLLVSLKYLFPYHTKQLNNEGYVQESCNRVFNAELHERQLLTIKFSGNIRNVVAERNQIEFTFFSLFPNIQKITVKEIDNQAQNALKAFRGYLDLYTRALVRKPLTNNENKSKKNNNQFVMEEETVRLAHLLLSIPKTSFPNISHFHSFAFRFKDYKHCIKLIKKVSSKIGHNWWELGINLGISEARLESLKFHYLQKGNEKIAEQMLFCWLKGCHTYDNKYTMLIEALIKCDRIDIAKNLDSPHESDLIFGC